jgi:hypothetical protein
MLSPKLKKDEKPQFERFIDAAKRAEAAETDAQLKDAIRKIARSPATKQPKEKRGS